MPVVGAMCSDNFKPAFGLVREATALDTRSLNYLLWKCMTMSGYMSSVFSILSSPPFMCGFPSTLWHHVTDIMLRKKLGVSHIHTVRIIGLVCVEFNTALKFFSRKIVKNYERSDPHSEQWGGRNNRSKLISGFCRAAGRTGAAAVVFHHCRGGGGCLKIN